MAVTAVCTAAALIGGVLAAGPAQAFRAVDASLTMTSDPGDTTGFGGTFAFSTGTGDLFDTTSNLEGSSVTAEVRAANGEQWQVRLAAPDTDPLTTGTYTGATGFPTPGQPLVKVDGIGFCFNVTGSFTVTSVVIVQKYVQTFHASFEQHCDGQDAALRGELRIDNPPPPPPLTVGVTIDPAGLASKVSGRAEVSGTVTCNHDVAIALFGDVTEIVHKTRIASGFEIDVACTADAPVPWRATVDAGTLPYENGTADVLVRADATDPFFGDLVTVRVESPVRLKWTHDVIPLSAG